jgi:hypothetical protein
MFRAVEVFAIVAPERKINFHPALLASQTVRLPGNRRLCDLPAYNVGTIQYSGAKCCLNVQHAARNSASWKSVSTAGNYSAKMIILPTWHGSDVTQGWQKSRGSSGEDGEKLLSDMDTETQKTIHPVLTTRKPEWSTRTPEFLRKYGFIYDSSMMNDDKPYLMQSGSGAGIYELPVEWFLDDWTLFEERRQSPGAVLEAWRSEFDAVHDLGVGYFMLTMHPECIGRASRMSMLERLVNHIGERQGIAFARCDELVEYLQSPNHLIPSNRTNSPF